jgi:cohesin complex subunit SA-1/2
VLFVIINEFQFFSMSDNVEDLEAGPSGQRMTRLRARGGVPTRPPIIDDDEDDFAFSNRKRKTPKPPKEKIEREPREPKPPKPPKEPKHQPQHHHHNESTEDKSVVKEREITTDESSLFWILRYSKNTNTMTVDEWIENYKIDRENALIVLMQFFINASGCKGKITSEMTSSMEHTAIIRRMTEEFDEESGEYPLIMAGQQWKKFRTHFCDFVQTLVKQCQYSIIYDQFLMDNVISLLTGLSDSQVRAFRHTATLAAMKLMTALVDVALLVSVYLDNAARQYESERMKSVHDVSEDRLETLMGKRQELEENMDEIKNMLTYLFKSVFVHRYRDTLPEIRSICMTEIGIWMQKFSSNFLDDSYLKYIGWTLHDKVGDVRLRCLQALLPLYENEELKGKLELFTSKFKDRIVAMTLDKEYEVAVHAVRLVIKILKIHQDILTDKDCEIVYELVYSSHRGVAQAAAEFLNVRLFFIDPSIESYTRRGKKRLPNTPLVRDLVQFFIESELHEHGAYLVDAFIENNPMVKDWECMTDLLWEEAGPGEEVMDNKQESTLIEIMVSAVKQVALGEPPVGRGSNRQKTLSAKEVKQLQDDKAKLTEHFIQTLPYLLDKYSAENAKLINLLNIPQYFDLEMYTTTRQEASLKLLLDKITHITQISTDREVLDACAKTLEFLCTEGSAIYTQCDVARSNIIDESVNRYKEAIDDWRNLIAGEETPDEDEIHQVVISLKKVSILYSCHNLNHWNLFNSIFQDIEEFLTSTNHETNIPTEALVYCIESCYFSITWGLSSIDSAFESSALEYQAKELRENLEKFMATMSKLMQGNDVPSSIKEAVSCLSLILKFHRNYSYFTLKTGLYFNLRSTCDVFTKSFKESKSLCANDDLSSKRLSNGNSH